MKTCPRCGENKDESDYQKNAKRPDGLQSACKACRKVIDAAAWTQHKARRLVRREDVRKALVLEIRQIKAITPCADCGGIFHPAAMQFDHRPGEVKIASVAVLCMRRSRRAVMTEIKKCDVVCSNCHAIRTYERREGSDREELWV